MSSATGASGGPGTLGGSRALDVPRIAPGSRIDVGLIAWTFATIAGRVARTEPPNLFLTLGRHRRLFRGWLHFAGTLMPGGRLARRESELVILRVAHRQGSTYEFDHHVRLGKRAGVTPDDLRRLTASVDTASVDTVVGDNASSHGTTGGWSPREAAMLDAVDALIDQEDLDDAQWRSIAAHLDPRELIELVMLVGHYRMLATAITVLRIQPDAPRG
ncbi:MAG TPA: carboxymuconolactone decarboxylase family protein [Microthrixaceae bacterium]|jgi:alkylhydroperoxidase family enzyme|nr:carboxymuconolactone decarboxylase family protein [Microthrixaceae bacterium]